MFSSVVFPSVSLYVHIPFCRSKCRYCDFNSFSGLMNLAPAYVKAVASEMAVWSTLYRQASLPFTVVGQQKLRVRTIYFGGGTPTLLGGDFIAALLSACDHQFNVEAGAEITVEANPGTVNSDLLCLLRSLGANRLSIGAQSLSPRLLRLLGRTHSETDTASAVEAARAAGFDNLSLDLIYGIPTQSLEDWREDISRALAIGPSHLSLYGLSVEEGTPLSSDVAGGRLPVPDLDLAADMYQLAGEMLAGSGYRHYEISNWARPGARCEHNLAYWRNLPYIGLGAGAHSSFCSLRLANEADPAKYVDRLAAASRLGAENETPGGALSYIHGAGAVDEVEEIDRKAQMSETAILGLRLMDGLDNQTFRSRFGTGVESVYGPEIGQLRDLGLVEWHGDRLALTDRGMLLGNEVFVRFLDG